MNKIFKNKIYILIPIIALFEVSFVSAQTSVNCKDSFAPTFICQRYADLTSTFSVSAVIIFALYCGIAGAVIFILFQIGKAIFIWINKASEDKARGAAIKAVSNAVIAGIVLLVMLVVVIFGADILGIGGIPAPLYACYSNTVFGVNSFTDVDGNTATLINKSGQINELSGIIAYEGKPSDGTSGVGSGGVVGGPTTPGNHDYNQTSGQLRLIIKDQNLLSYLNDNLICRDKNTGKEYTQGYVILKRIGINK